MSESTRPSMQSVQKSLLIGAVAGLILGILVGIVVSVIYVRSYPPVYQGGAYPNELTKAYQTHYLAMVVDSYLVNQDLDTAQKRLKSFDAATKIRVLGERSGAYVAAGRGVEAQLINNLAVTLKGKENWDDAAIKTVVGELTTQFQADPARAQAVSTYSAALLNGQVPVPAAQAAAAGQPTATPPTEAAQGGGISWVWYLFCCVLLLIVILIVYILSRRQLAKRPAKPVIEWEGEGVPPLKVWNGTYTFGQDLYDEFFTLETEDNLFLGEGGMAILDTVPGATPKQVLSFDVGLFDKTDITTRSVILMSEYAYNDPKLRAKADANPQAEPVLVEPGKTFKLESSAMRVEGKIEGLVYGAGGNMYFEKLAVRLNLFVREGADLKRGQMDVPDQYRD